MTKHHFMEDFSAGFALKVWVQHCGMDFRAGNRSRREAAQFRKILNSDFLHWILDKNKKDVADTYTRREVIFVIAIGDLCLQDLHWTYNKDFNLCISDSLYPTYWKMIKIYSLEGCHIAWSITLNRLRFLDFICCGQQGVAAKDRWTGKFSAIWSTDDYWGFPWGCWCSFFAECQEGDSHFQQLFRWCISIIL